MVVAKGAIVKQQVDINDLPMDIADYHFDIIQEHAVSLSSQMTDNWMENNTVINDHIANSPIVVSLRGLAGEWVYVPDEQQANTVLSQASYESNIDTLHKLSKLSVLYPPIDNSTQFAKNQRDYIEASYNRYRSVVKQFFNFNNPPALRFQNPVYDSKLKKIYNRLETMRVNKMPFTVETPFKTFQDMYIQSISLRQANVLYSMDIEITFKQGYFTDTKWTEADQAVLDRYNQWQRAEEENQGKVQGGTSVLKQATDKLGWTTPGSGVRDN